PEANKYAGCFRSEPATPRVPTHGVTQLGGLMGADPQPRESDNGSTLVALNGEVVLHSRTHLRTLDLRVESSLFRQSLDVKAEVVGYPGIADDTHRHVEIPGPKVAEHDFALPGYTTGSGAILVS